MSFNGDYELACKKEKQRLEIAEGWAKIHPSKQAMQFKKGRNDRLEGRPCSSADGSYLDGYYSV